MNGNLSPEEKLLRLIKGEDKIKPKILPDQDSAVAKTLPVVQPVTTKIFLKKPFHFAIQKYLNFVNLRKTLPFLLAAFIIYFIASLIYPFVCLRNIKLSAVSKERFENSVIPKEETKPYEFYLEGARQRQIFATPITQETIGSAGVETSSIKDINLIGIISGDNPQAVIEDKKAQKTFYVTKGQFIGEFRIDDIQQGKIILTNRGQRFELYI